MNKMGKHKQRKKRKSASAQKPVTAVQKPQKTNKNKEAKKSCQLIAEVHRVNKELEFVKTSAKLTDVERAKQVGLLSRKLEELGGINLYQQLSASAERHHGNFNTAQWVVQKLKAKGLLPPKTDKVELLDVGALDLNYAKHTNWIACTAIDLNPQKPEILKADFLSFQDGESSLYDVLVLSLVINFEGNLARRGEMLVKAQTLCKLRGHVFVMLPRACLHNSRYMTSDLLDTMMTKLGFVLSESHDTRKLCLRMYCKAKTIIETVDFKKTKIKHGAKMNNFCITMKTS